MLLSSALKWKFVSFLFCFFVAIILTLWWRCSLAKMPRCWDQTILVWMTTTTTTNDRTDYFTPCTCAWGNYRLIVAIPDAQIFISIVLSGDQIAVHMVEMLTASSQWGLSGFHTGFFIGGGGNIMCQCYDKTLLSLGLSGGMPPPPQNKY